MKFFVKSIGSSEGGERVKHFWKTRKPQYFLSGDELDANNISIDGIRLETGVDVLWTLTVDGYAVEI